MLFKSFIHKNIIIISKMLKVMFDHDTIYTTNTKGGNSLQQNDL